MALSIFAIGMNAQDRTTKDQNELKQQKMEDAVQYCCPKGDFCDTKPGKCPKDNLDLIKAGTYYCEKCATTNDKQCKCPVCDMDMKKMECKKMDPDKNKGVTR